MILAVVGGKGGVGTSTIALELTAALDGLVVDADLGMADLPGGRGPDLHDVLAGRAAPEAAIREGPVDQVPCGRSLAGAGAAEVDTLADALRCIEREYSRRVDGGSITTDGSGTQRGNEVVVVDCPNGMRADAGVPLAVADACVVVASPRGFALADAVRTRELARELETGLTAVALNRVVDDPPVDAISRVLGAPTEVVPADPRLQQTLRAGTPVTDRCPESEPATRIERLAGHVRRCRHAGS